MSEGKQAALIISGIGGIVLLIALVICLFGSWFIISPGERGVVATLGKLSSVVNTEGLNFKLPLISGVYRIDIKQQTREMQGVAFSSDLQALTVKLQVLYRIPEQATIDIVSKYNGDPFDSLVAPRIQEALKEVTALKTAQDIVKQREEVKVKTLAVAKQKIGEIVLVADVVIENIDLSDEMERAIEQKMVQEQAAAKAKFTQMQAEVDAKTAVIRAEGEANAIRIRGEALAKNPQVIQLQMVEKWNGVTPLVIGAGEGANILLPVTGK